MPANRACPQATTHTALSRHRENAPASGVAEAANPRWCLSSAAPSLNRSPIGSEPRRWSFAPSVHPKGTPTVSSPAESLHLAIQNRRCRLPLRFGVSRVETRCEKMAVCECVPDPGALELFDTQRTDIGESVRALPGFRWVAQRAGTPSTGWAVADWQTSRPPPAVAVWAHRNGASAGRSAALPVQSNA